MAAKKAKPVQRDKKGRILPPRGSNGRFRKLTAADKRQRAKLRSVEPSRPTPKRVAPKKSARARGPDGRFISVAAPPPKRRPKARPKKKAARPRGPDGRFIRVTPPPVAHPDELEFALNLFWYDWLGPGSASNSYVFPKGGWSTEGLVKTDFTSYLFQLADLAEKYPPDAPAGTFSAACRFTPAAGVTDIKTELLDYRRGGGTIEVNQVSNSRNVGRVQSVLAGLARLITNAIDDGELLPATLIFRIHSR